MMLSDQKAGWLGWIWELLGSQSVLLVVKPALQALQNCWELAGSPKPSASPRSLKQVTAGFWAQAPPAAQFPVKQFGGPEAAHVPLGSVPDVKIVHALDPLQLPVRHCPVGQS